MTNMWTVQVILEHFKQVVMDSNPDSYIWRKHGCERRIHLACPTDSVTKGKLEFTIMK